MANSPSGESMLTRTFRIIDAFNEADPLLSVSEIAQRADLPMTTAHRIINELVNLRVLARDRQRKIRLGTRLWETSQRASHEMRLRMTALPVLQRVQQVVQSHTHLAVMSHNQVLYLERLSMPSAVGNTAHPASRIPAHQCSPGLILLAYAPAEVQHRALEAHFVTNTPASIKDGEELRIRLAECRKQGFAVAAGMLLTTSKGVAVPIIAEEQRVVAALSVVVPVERDHQPLIPLLMQAARAISTQLGTTYVADDSAWTMQTLEAGQHLADETSALHRGQLASRTIV